MRIEVSKKASGYGKTPGRYLGPAHASAKYSQLMMQQ